MKIRIRANAVRIRLTKSEVHQLCTLGSVEEITSFAEKHFSYGVWLSKEHDQLHASFKDNRISLLLPEKQGRNWHLNEEIGFQNEMELAGGNRLSLLLEKDFTCLSPRGEDETDNYLNPKEVM